MYLQLVIMMILLWRNNTPQMDFMGVTKYLNFFIIQIRDEMDSIYGPLTKKEFALKAKEFDIQNITFDMKYPEMCYD